LQELKNQIYDYFSNDKQNQTLVIFDFKHLLKKENNSRKECIALPINAILDTPKIKWSLIKLNKKGVEISVLDGADRLQYLIDIAAEK